MATLLQNAVTSRLTGLQLRSLNALQDKVERDRGFASTTIVSPAQMLALQAAYDAAKASGVEVPAHVAATAAKLGLK